MNAETKVGIFALAAILVIGFITLRVGSRSFMLTGGFDVKFVMDSAVGVRVKTPVEIAGIKVGQVKDIELLDNMKAEVVLSIDGGVELPEGTTARLRSKGFLGEVLVELLPGAMSDKKIADGSTLSFVGQGGDVNSLLMQFSSIADDVKTVTSSLKNMAGSDTNSPVGHIVGNLEAFTQTLANNQANFNKISDNLAALTEALRGTVAKSRENVEESLQRISSITRKVDEGKGTIGKLVNDDETVVKLNEAVDNLNNALGGLRHLETQIGYHTEYMANAKEFKQYVSLNLKPRPDKMFMFDFVQDPLASPTVTSRQTTISTGGTSTTINSQTLQNDENQFRFSAQIAKEFYDFWLRGGIVESRGGFGLDYGKGPVGAQFTAYDFNRPNNERAHLKLAGTLNLTDNIYLTGGADDFINKQTGTDWFFGAGLRLVDEDVKSLLGVASGASAVKK